MPEPTREICKDWLGTALEGVCADAALAIDTSTDAGVQTALEIRDALRAAIFAALSDLRRRSVEHLRELTGKELNLSATSCSLLNIAADAIAELPLVEPAAQEPTS